MLVNTVRKTLSKKRAFALATLLPAILLIAVLALLPGALWRETRLLTYLWLTVLWIYRMTFLIMSIALSLLLPVRFGQR